MCSRCGPTACCTCRMSAITTRFARFSSPAPTSSPPGWNSRIPAALDADIFTRVCRKPVCAATVPFTRPAPAPVFITEALPIVLASIQRRLDNLQIDEFADCSSRDSPEMLFDMMGFGRKTRAGEPGPAGSCKTVFRAIIATRRHRPRPAVRQHRRRMARRAWRAMMCISPPGVVPAGTVAATRTTVSGIREWQAVDEFHLHLVRFG